jgi:hypothetical protein
VSPFTFLGASFFIEGLLCKPLCIFVVPLFSSEVFYVSPFAFFGVYFFIGYLFYEPMNEGS